MWDQTDIPAENAMRDVCKLTNPESSQEEFIEIFIEICRKAVLSEGIP